MCKAEEIIKTLKDSAIYIDSNIFMDFEFNNIFEYIIKNKIEIVILKSQYDEMINLRNKHKSSETDIAKTLIPQLTLALNRIEKLLDNTESNIKDIGFDSDKNAYADVDFIKEILKKLKEEKSILFITQDRDLRTRLKTMIKDDKEISKENIYIFKANEFIEYVSKDINIETNELIEQIKFDHSGLSEETIKALEEASKTFKPNSTSNYENNDGKYCPNCEEYVTPYKSKKDIDYMFHKGSTYLIEECTTCNYEFSKKHLSDYDNGLGLY